jgi:hypothetical protein
MFASLYHRVVMEDARVELYFRKAVETLAGAESKCANR